MKLFITFCATVAVFFAPAEAGFGETAFNKLKDSLTHVTVELEKFNSGLETDFINKMDGFSAKWKKPLEAFLDYTVDDANKKIAAAKEEGKEVDHCFPPLEFVVESTKNDMELGLQKCIDISVIGLEKYQEQITVHIENKKSVEAKLDQFVNDCKEEESASADEKCLLKSLFQATIAVGKYDATAFKYMGSAKLYLGSSYIDVFKCFQEPSKTFLSSLETGKTTVTECIESA